MPDLCLRALCLQLAALLLAVWLTAEGPAGDLGASVQWRYVAPQGACEIVAYSAASGRLFVTVGESIDVVDLGRGGRLDSLVAPEGFLCTSVACCRNDIAVAWAARDSRKRGQVRFYTADSLTLLASYPVGYHPDMVLFTPDGRRLLAANEGEPSADYATDNEGSVSVVTAGADWTQATVIEVGFHDFEQQSPQLQAAGLHLSGPSSTTATGRATFAQDLEPEYIAVSADSRRAWITLQENNALAELDLQRGRITAICPLGMKSFHALGPLENDRPVACATGSGLDASDRDGGPCIRRWPVWGIFQPDGIATFQHAGHDYLVTANEGDPRDYISYDEEVRIGQLAADDIHLDRCNPVRNLTADRHLGRLKISRAAGDLDGDGDLDRCVVCGTRSFAVWKRQPGGLQQVFDSGSDFERIIAEQYPQYFNIDSTPASLPDERSCTRGPEPENLLVFQLGRARYVAIGLERTGGVMLYELSNPDSPGFVAFVPPHESQGVRDRAPEGLLFVPAADNVLAVPLLIVANEASGTLTAYRLEQPDP